MALSLVFLLELSRWVHEKFDWHWFCQYHVQKRRKYSSEVVRTYRNGKQNIAKNTFGKEALTPQFERENFVLNFCIQVVFGDER